MQQQQGEEIKPVAASITRMTQLQTSRTSLLRGTVKLIICTGSEPVALLLLFYYQPQFYSMLMPGSDTVS